ncbi:MAG: hypothetical protein JNN12_10610 [Bacteroidetes Order II. Incertae sedis bacterium]|nr:hypothetical protein [Bacteroidetes Order II. bacterium]
MSATFIRIVLSFFLEEGSPNADKSVGPRFVDHKRLTKPGDFFGDKLFHDTPPCWEGTLPAKRKIARLIHKEAKKLGAFYIDSRNEVQTLGKITVHTPDDHQDNFWNPIHFTYLILSIPRKGGPYSPGLYIDEKDIYPNAWTMRVTRVDEQGVAHYDVTLQEIKPKTWVLIRARWVLGFHYDFVFKKKKTS